MRKREKVYLVTAEGRPPKKTNKAVAPFQSNRRFFDTFRRDSA